MKYSKVTISGKICTGKSTLFKKLKKKLNWPAVQTGQIFRDYVKKHNLNLEKAEEQNEFLTKRVDYKVREMLKNPKGKLLADSWMAGIMADAFPHVLKILLVTDDELRYKRFAIREKIIFNEAKKRVEERQLNWINRMKKIYHRDDFFDPKKYNLVIDTSDLKPEEILQIILEKLISA